MKDLKSQALRGGVARGGAQAANFLLRLGCLVVFAHLLEPTDFGLVGMVTAVTGLLDLFREFGLSVATVQRSEINDRQTSTLFWVNILVGICLFLIAVGIAPLVASFFREPRLGLIMAVLGLGFLFNAAGVQHSALLQRRMRFTALAIIDVVALLVSSALSVALAVGGFGYWSLVAWSIALPFTTTIQLWFCSRWIPGKPSMSVGAGSMVRFGSIVTLNMLVVHVAYNLDKVLLGRVWGAEVVGIYGRAYQLITLPTAQITAMTGSIAISALSRLQDDPRRLWSFFKKGYSLVLAMTIPISIICALFPAELILVMFGSKWSEAIPVFRLLVPTVLAFAIINPTGWLLVALGLIRRSLYLALVIAPLVIAGCVIGLPYGAEGVALGFSVSIGLWVVPHLVWCFHGTGVTFREVLPVIGRPLISGAVAAMCTLGVLAVTGRSQSNLLTLILGSALFFSVYLYVLLFVFKQIGFYVDIFRSLRQPAGQETVAVP